MQRLTYMGLLKLSVSKITVPQTEAKQTPQIRTKSCRTEEAGEHSPLGRPDEPVGTPALEIQYVPF